MADKPGDISMIAQLADAVSNLASAQEWDCTWPENTDTEIKQVVTNVATGAVVNVRFTTTD